MDIVADVIAGVALLASVGQLIYTQVSTRPQLNEVRRKQEREDRVQAELVGVEPVAIMDDDEDDFGRYGVYVGNGSSQPIHGVRAGIRFKPTDRYIPGTTYTVIRRRPSIRLVGDDEVHEGSHIERIRPGEGYQLGFAMRTDAAPNGQRAVRFEDHAGRRWQTGMDGRVTKLRPEEWEG